MKFRKQHIALFSLIIIAPVLLVFNYASTDDSKTLFIITRNFDEDILKYDLRVDTNGAVVEDDPIHPYWIRNSEGGVIKELNAMQRKFAYGLEFDRLDADFYRFNFVSYDKLDLYLKKASNGEYHVLTKIKDKFVIVKEIFLQVEKNGTIFNLPKLTWVDIKWYSTSNKKNGETRIDPNE